MNTQDPSTMSLSTSSRPIAMVVTGTTLLVLLAMGVVHAAGDKKPAEPAGKPALTVSLVQPQRASLALQVSANGSIAAWQEASVGAEVQGLRLAEVRANIGDQVRRGQVLASFARDMTTAELAQSRAALAEAEAALAEAAANAQRARDLQGSGALSAQQIGQYLSAERAAQARVLAQRAAVDAHELRLRQTQVTAPDDGIISARNATVGAVMPQGQELFRLIRQGRLEWRAEVAASDLARLKVGMPVTVMPPGVAPLSGRVRMIAPTVDPATRNGLVYVDLPRGSAARAGMFARGSFEIGASGALTLPQSAVLLREGFSIVLTVGADNRVGQTKVSTGRRVGDQVEITSGLDAGARVVAAGGGFLTDGDLVRVVQATAAPAPAAAASK